ncbi:MAG: hybrid sensor histidine kinase/response regulator [Cyanobacteria bacterium P01_D01_bin.1]
MNDELVRFAEEPSVEPASEPQRTWKIMLVDDEPSIHQATKVALKFFTFKGRSLSFVSAYSASEAKRLIAKHPDTVLVLLDVIMDTPDAGLQVAKYIREELHNTAVRIVLRTGQPGQIPEESVVINYDINDYKTKLELTQEKLFTTVVSSIRAYCDLVALFESQAALAKANSELAALNRSLEQRVRDRTQALTHEIEEREKAEESLRLYIHALTHDLRNPVTGMSTILQTLLGRTATGDPPQVQISISVLSRMKAGCDRQLKMINTLLETQEVKVWGVSLKHYPFDLGAMVFEILENWQPRLNKKRVSVVTQIAPDLSVEGDRTQLWRVFENLIDNALKYNPPGITLTLTINLYSQAPNPKDSDLDTEPSSISSSSIFRSSVVYCAIQDNGVGIPQQQRTALFELYQRGASSSPSQGLGLGLYICRCIISAHGGTIGVNSPLPDHNGTEFWFTLPVRHSSCIQEPLDA